MLLLLLLLLSAARQATYSACVHHGLVSWHRRGRSADASRARAETCPPKTKGPVGAACLFPDRVRGVPRLGHVFGATPAERRPAGALDAVLVPLNPGIVSISPSSTTGAPVCRTVVLPYSFNQAVASTAAFVVLAGKRDPILSPKFGSTNKR